MEASSPLAAMQPSLPMAAWGNGQDLFRSHPHAHFSGAAGGIGSRALRERLQKTDYFNVKEFQASSPAASLAADLSQNFRLDNEARFVCPRVLNSVWGYTDWCLQALISQLQGVRSSPPT
jgi:M-phase inducer tyrosine phosphatase